MALGLMGRFDEAKNDLDRAIAINPDFRPAWLNRGVVNWRQENRPAALTDFAVALQPPENRVLIEAAFYRAQMFVTSKEYDRALNDLNSFISVKKDFAPAYLLRANVYLLQGNQKSGLADVDNLLQYTAEAGFDPATAQGLGQRGQILRHIAAQLPNEQNRRTLELASGDLEKAIQLGGRSAQVYADLGAVRDNLGQTENAVTAYSEAIDMDGGMVRFESIAPGRTKSSGSMSRPRRILMRLCGLIRRMPKPMPASGTLKPV